MSNYLTIQEVAAWMGCSTRSVYRKMDAIAPTEQLEAKGMVKRILLSNGTHRRMYSEQWVKSTFKTIPKKAKKSKLGTLDTQAFDLLKDQLQIKDEQINTLSTQLGMALERIKELQNALHINNVDESSPKISTTVEYLSQNPDSALHYTNTEEKEIIVEEENHLSNFSNWLTSL